MKEDYVSLIRETGNRCRNRHTDRETESDRHKGRKADYLDLE